LMGDHLVLVGCCFGLDHGYVCVGFAPVPSCIVFNSFSRQLIG
jgi:hypothetical protein